MADLDGREGLKRRCSIANTKVVKDEVGVVGMD
jgi:hypothetical protein